MPKSLYITLSAFVLLLASAASYAVADGAAPQARTVTVASVAVIKACKNVKTGALYILSKCPKGDTAVTWNAKGPAGVRGATGASGSAGPPGSAGAAGKNGTNSTNGTDGTNGTSATLSVGTVSTGAAGSSASVTNVGTSSAAKLNFSIPQGAAGTAGTAGAAGTAPWSTPVVLTNNQNTGTEACPYVAATAATAGTPATAIDFNGSTYQYTGTTCKYAYTSISGVNTNSNTPDVDPSDWTAIALAEANGTADAWAFIDPGVCAAGGACSAPVIKTGGVSGAAVSFDYLGVGQYRLDVTGCPAADTPSAGSAFPLDVQVTPEGAYPGESSHDSSVIQVTSSVRDTTSLGVLNGLGIAEFYMYLGTPDQTTIGQTDSVDEPFAVSVTC